MCNSLESGREGSQSRYYVLQSPDYGWGKNVRSGHKTKGSDAMDFIEQIFGWSPDGGSGSFEVALFLVPLFGAGVVLLWRRWRRA